MSERTFTVEEANALLEELSTSLRAIRDARRLVLSAGEVVKRAATSDGGGRAGAEYWNALSTLRREVVGITSRGIVLRDAETGLIDFPARRDGRDVFLCWRLGEPHVGYWHGPESGFPGRRPL